MRASSNVVVVLVTTPNRRVASRLARLAVGDRLAACVQIHPAIESHYRWAGRIESAKEILVVFKTLRAALPSLEALVAANHPYDTPQFIVIPAVSGSAKYLSWIDESVAVPAAAATGAKRRN